MKREEITNKNKFKPICCPKCGGDMFDIAWRMKLHNIPLWDGSDYDNLRSYKEIRCQCLSCDKKLCFRMRVDRRTLIVNEEKPEARDERFAHYVQFQIEQRGKGLPV